MPPEVLALPETSPGDNPLPYKYLEFFAEAFLEKGRKTPVKNPNPASARR